MKTSRFITTTACVAIAALFTTNIIAANVDANASTETENSAITTTSLYVNVSHNDRVEPHDTDRYTHTFYAGESVWISVRGDGDTDLDLYIYDSDGNLVTSDTDTDDNCLCIFTPRRTQKYTIRIKNYGNVYNRYHLCMIQ